MQLRNWGENCWRVYEGATKDEKRRTLLGSRDLIDGGKEERKRRDLAVKEFIQEVNTYRKEILGLPDLRGAFYQPQEASLEEARDWERTFRLQPCSCSMRCSGLYASKSNSTAIELPSKS